MVFRARVHDNRGATCKLAGRRVVLQSNFVELGLGKCFCHAAVGSRHRRRAFGRINRGGRSVRRENFFRGRSVNLRGGRRAQQNFCEPAAQRGASADARIGRGIFLLRRADFASPDNFVADNFFAGVQHF